MTAPLVSVIIPIHNAAPYLEETLQSLVDQEFHTELLEAILLEDGCSDDSPTIIAEFTARHPWARAVKVAEPDGYSGKPRNIGVRHATGRYLYFLDADDLMTASGLKRLVGIAESSEADIVTGGFEVFNRSGTTDTWLFGSLFGSDPPPFTAEQLPIILAKPPSLAANLFRRSLIEDYNLHFPTGIVATDTVFWTRSVLRAKSIAYIDSVIYRYRSPRDRGDPAPTLSEGKDVGYFRGLLSAYRLALEAIDTEYAPQEKILALVGEVHFQYLLKRLNRPDVDLSPASRAELMTTFAELLARFPELRRGEAAVAIEGLLGG